MTSPETKVSAFVHWKHIANVMQQANTDGVKCTLYVFRFLMMDGYATSCVLVDVVMRDVVQLDD